MVSSIHAAIGDWRGSRQRNCCPPLALAGLKKSCAGSAASWAYVWTPLIRPSEPPNPRRQCADFLFSCNHLYNFFPSSVFVCRQVPSDVHLSFWGQKRTTCSLILIFIILLPAMQIVSGLKRGILKIFGPPTICHSSLLKDCAMSQTINHADTSDA